MKLLIKHPGDTLIAFILLVFIAVAVMIILAMPAGIMTTAFSVAQIGTLEGDPLGLHADNDDGKQFLVSLCHFLRDYGNDVSCRQLCCSRQGEESYNNRKQKAARQ